MSSELDWLTFCAQATSGQERSLTQSVRRYGLSATTPKPSFLPTSRNQKNYPGKLPEFENYNPNRADVGNDLAMKIAEKLK